jgi:uncharacterized protein with PIN domain
MPSDDIRFLCDEMLGRLARYLRAAGYDTSLASSGEPDAVLLARAHAEHRRFLTRDTLIAEHKAARGVAVLLPPGDLDTLAAALSADLGVDWLRRPFTRCLVDNAVLASAHPAADLPPDVHHGDARRCPTCGRVYWAGSHHRRMLARLDGWRRGHFPP